jgi:Uma2 family endonuclease
MGTAKIGDEAGALKASASGLTGKATIMATDVRSSRAELIRVLSEWTPAWERAQTFPVRYPCTEEDYLALDLNRLLEFADGFLEVLPTTTTYHQRISAFLFKALDAWITAQQLGEVLFAPLKVWIRKGKFREPDLIFMRSEHAARIGDKYWKRPDLVIEIVSPKNRRHDLETKRDEYARARIPEYWIVDPEEETITVLVLRPRQKTYTVHGRFGQGSRAASKLLPGFSVDVTETFSRRP